MRVLRRGSLYTIAGVGFSRAAETDAGGKVKSFDTQGACDRMRIGLLWMACCACGMARGAMAVRLAGWLEGRKHSCRVLR